MQASAEGDVQGVVQILSEAVSAWFMAHAPQLLLAHPRCTYPCRLTCQHVSLEQLCSCISIWIVDVDAVLFLAARAWRPATSRHLGSGCTA